MLRAWTHRNNVDIHHRSSRAWLATTAHRLAVDAHRARQPYPVSQPNWVSPPSVERSS